MDLDNPSYFNCMVSSTSSTTSSTSSRNTGSSALLRSVSSNSGDSNQELLILGQPRLSDIAPDLKYSSGSHHNGNKPASRSNSLNSKQRANPIFDDDSRELDDNVDEDEVFLDVGGGAKYTAVGVSTNGRRRYSLGSEQRRRSSFELTTTAAIASEAGRSGHGPVIDDHALRHASFPRKRCPRCTPKALIKKNANMDDILIVGLKSSEAAALWVDYFTSYFEQISKQANRKPFKIQYIWAEDYLDGSLKDDTSERAANVKLQLVVLCPNFLAFTSEYPTRCTDLGKLFIPDRTLALLLGVSDNDLTDIQRRVLPTYFQWQRLSVGQDQDETFTKEFLSHAMAILSRVWKQQSSNGQEKHYFSVSPKKIRQGQNSVFILLAYPLQKEDMIKVSVELNNEIHEVKSVKRRNPYTIKISVPDNLTDTTAIINVLLEKNGSIVGSRPIKCESKLRELEQILRAATNPVEFMCQSLGFNPTGKDQIDTWFLQAFQKNYHPHFNLLTGGHAPTPFSAAMQAHKHSHEEYPTLLHFAAKFGFEKLAMELMECPGADVAYEIRNVFDMTPSEIAEANGFPQLATTLKGYMNMNEFTNVYSTLKEMSLNPTKATSVIEENGYLTPRLTSPSTSADNFYKWCPPPRPVLPPLQMHHPPLLSVSGGSGDKSLSGSGVSVKSSSSMQSLVTTPKSPLSDCCTPMGYLAMTTPPGAKSMDKLDDDTSTSTICSTPSTKSKDQSPRSQKNPQAPPTTPTPSPTPSSTVANGLLAEEDKVQKELLEIILDFKNNVHSIAQVEKLVDEWKNRNDVQRSFKEKQEQLNEMRMRYERIQHEMKASMKKPTPFDRIRKYFHRNKNGGQQNGDEANGRGYLGHISQPILSSSPSIVAIQTARPVSSLSTSSSGSSGRISTISGSSLGDSGTHSDNEERKNIIGIHHNDEEFKNIFTKVLTEMSYTAPPKHKMPFETIDENKAQPQTMATRPDTLPIGEQYYIRFPPSGRPIAEFTTFKNPGSPVGTNQEYMNVPADNLLSQSDVGRQQSQQEQHDYMNVKGTVKKK